MLRYAIIYGFSLVVAFVAAQTEPDNCLLTCSERAANAAGCPTYVDLPCMCSTTYRSTGSACIRQLCPTQLPAWDVVEQGACTDYTGAVSGGPPTITTPAPTSSTRPASSSALRNARLAGVIGALAAIVSIAIF